MTNRNMTDLIPMQASLVTAYRKGRKAFESGSPITACPYADHRTARGSVTYSRAYRTAWFEGWCSMRDGEPERYRPAKKVDGHWC